MAKILVLRRPTDEVYDEISCADDEVGETVQEVYNELNNDYSIEVRYD